MRIGVLLHRRYAFGFHYLIPKVCGTYFLGKAGLCYVQKHYPSFYEERLHAHSAFFSKVWNRIIPEDYMKYSSYPPLIPSCYNVISSLFRPYLSKFDNISPVALLGGIYKAGTTQVRSHHECNP